MGPVVVFPGDLDGGALAVPGHVLGQHAVAHGGAALEGEAELAAVAEAVDHVVAVDGALWRERNVMLAWRGSLGSVLGVFGVVEEELPGEREVPTG